MPPIEDSEKLILKLAQFKLFCNDTKHVDTKNIDLVLQGLDLDLKVPCTSYLRKHSNEEIIGDSLLHLSFNRRNIDVYNTLIQKGADYNTKNKQGCTVLHRAFHIFCSNYQMFQWNFLEMRLYDHIEKCIVSTLSAHMKYGNTNNPSDPNGLTHFHIACGTNNTKVVKFFLNNGVLVNQAVIHVNSIFSCSRQLLEGYTPLHIAAEFGCVQVIEILLKHGADTNLKNTKGQTPLQRAVEKNIKMVDLTKRIHVSEGIKINEQVINLLINHNISSEFSSLFVVCVLKDSHKAKSFLAKAIDVNKSISMDSQIWPGYTALHFAAHANVETVKLLVRHGANIEAKEANGVTPFDMCIDRYKAEDIYDLICLVSSWKNILLSDGKTKLVELLLVFKYTSSFLKKSKDHVKLFVPFDSPLWPGFTVLHLAVLLSERRQCKSDYKKENDCPVFDPNLNVITEILKYNADVTVKDHRNWTAIHLAFRLKKHKTLNVLLQHHHRIENSIDDKNLSHLHIACAAKNTDLVEKLLWNDANVNIVYTGDSSVCFVYPGWTPLHVAVHQKNHKIMEMLLQFGADAHTTDRHGFTPIHQLLNHSTSHKESICETLLGLPNLRDCVIKDIGLSYLHVACAVGNFDAVNRLLDLRSDVNKVITCKGILSKDYPKAFVYENYDESTPLDLAIESRVYDSSELLNLLIERGADLFAKKSNKSLLCKMLKSGNCYFLNVIIEALARNVELRNRVETETGVTMLHVACRKLFIADPIKELLENGANVNAQVRDDSPTWPKFTCLHVMISENAIYEVDTIKLLIDHNADVTLKDFNGDTPLQLAYRKLRADHDDSTILNSVTLLLRAQKNFAINPTDVEGLSHFHIACHMLEVDVVENFLKHDIDVNSKIEMFCDSLLSANTPLHLAVRSTRNLHEADVTNQIFEFAQLRIVDLLIKHGAEVDVEDVFGNTPAHYAASCKLVKGDFLQRLANSGANVNARNVRAETPLELLLKKENCTFEELQSFITFGCHFNEFNTVTEIGYIALADSALSHVEMQTLLFKVFVNSADTVKVDVLKRTAIHNVVSTNNAKSNREQYNELFDIFMMFDCDVDDQDELGRTALHLAAQFRNEPAVAGLLLAGADINIMDHSGKTPFAYVFEPCSCCSNGKDKYHNQYSHKKLFQTFISQMQKMEVCKVFVNQSNWGLLSKALESYDSDSFKNNPYNVLLELARARKNLKIEPYSLTAVDFMLNSAAVIDFPTMSLAKREVISTFFRTKKRLFRVHFFNCAGILQLQYRQAVLRRKIINTAVESLRKLARCRLPDICCHMILRSLENFEIQNSITSTSNK